MIFFTFYDYVLGEKQVTTTTKKEAQPQVYTLQIITPARRFLALNFGGGLVKLSRLYNAEGKYIHPREYSPELVQEVKKYKKEFSIPYFKLWKGMIFALIIILIMAAVMALVNKVDLAKREGQTARLINHLQQLAPGQLYGVSFFTDESGVALEEMADGWVKINRIEGDTLFIQRSKQIDKTHALFNIEALQEIKPQTAEEWQEKEEKMNLGLLKKSLEQPTSNRFDVLYIGEDYANYRGVIFTFKASE